MNSIQKVVFFETHLEFKDEEEEEEAASDEE